jgi:hypothetical protein
MKNQQKRFYPMISRMRAKNLAKQLDEDDWKRFLAIVTHVPRPLINMALNETLKAESTAILADSKADAFVSRLKFYAKTFGIKYPD